MTNTLDSPRTGPSSPWIAASDLIGQEPLADFEVPPQLADAMAGSASEILYAMSGRQFTGITGPVKVRPLARPTDVDTRFGHRGAPGYVAATQASTAYGMPGGGVNYFGTSTPSEIVLGGYPIVDIQSVLIDGVLIPSNEYYVQDRRTLVRARPSFSATPTERFGWPMAQAMDLPDTQPNTFSVTYLYGVAPPQSGTLAATALATQLILNAIGEDNSLPQRVTSVSRQGVTVAVTDVMDFFSKGLTGIYECDLFIAAFNPTKAKMPPLVFSPDMGRPRRMPPGQ